MIGRAPVKIEFVRECNAFCLAAFSFVDFWQSREKKWARKWAIYTALYNKNKKKTYTGMLLWEGINTTK